MERVLLASLAGLTHDLGKVWAAVPASQRDPAAVHFDCPAPRGRFEDCPRCHSALGQAHAPLGANLLARTLPARLGVLAHPAAYHHARVVESDVVGWTIAADRIAAEEREERSDDGEAIPALRNPFAPNEAPRVKPGPLRADLLFQTVADRAAARAAAARAFGALEEALRVAADYAGEDDAALADHLLGAVYRGALGFPSAFYWSDADVSLASHCHLTAALAGALAAAGAPAQGELPADAVVAGVVSGDVSGIQEFVHGVASKRAARSLRARSFYLQVLAEVVARFVAREAGVPPTAIVGVVGGHFTVLVPPAAVERVGEMRAAVDRALYELHGPRLTVVLAARTATRAELGDYGALRHDLGAAVAAAKQRRFAESAAAIGLFEPRAATPYGAACRVCGADAADGPADEEGERRCAFCASLEEVGRRLPRARYLSVEPGAAEADGWTRAFGRLGFRVRLHDDPPPPPFAGALYALDDAAVDALPCARLFPVGKAVPLGEDGAPRDFGELAGAEGGRPALAVAKLDVDNLGNVLRDRFGAARHPTPSRVAAFSALLALFFEGHLNALAASAERVYVVYAGGDDLVCVGPPDAVLRFASAARADFRRWVGGDELTLSGGIALVEPTRPIARALEAAEAALERAKEHVHPDGRRKDAVVVDDLPMAWPRLEAVLADREQLVAAVRGVARREERGGALARSLLLRLRRLAEIEGPDGRVRYGPAVWRAYYDLSRFADRAEDPDVRAWLMGLYKRALKQGDARRIALAARLAELATAPGASDRTAGG
ncbi:MAG TPA: hypothetical protein VFC93_13355 [Chloroflexota bacterium]|nr:hypothetical protein [Chloroflexota bacterium]